MSNTFPFSPEINKVALWVLLLLFKCNSAVIKSSKWEQRLWQWIKLELFYISGACQHSGNCCRNLMIVNNGVPLHDAGVFAEAKQTKPHVYNRFFPKNQTKTGRITGYDCHCLTRDNYCNDYENRPKFCHNYPASAFLTEGKLLEGCGYHIALKPNVPRYLPSRLRALMTQVCTQ